MNAGFNVAAQQQRETYANQNAWSTRLLQTGPPGECADWALSCFFCPCAAAYAKHRADRSNPCYNLLCWNPIASYAYIRHEYGIDGPCGDDCGYGLLCGPCMIRQSYTETRIRGVSSKPWATSYRQNLEQWNRSMFDCSFCGLMRAIVCPCCVAAEVRSILQPTASGDDCFNCFCINPASVYGQVRNHYGIFSDCGDGEDICLPLFCFPCSLNRALTESKSRIKGSPAPRFGL
ncbi:Hypothetical protein, putative [Bodo saltans]|uniref:Uncharacterized protein n=1 Tax=Bodo saltans TaxID=75058 RepID=A0A0S4IWF4_BODSA|nr:Hypothetical protein, putative [Bodo saltans]|eukprot:CUF73241.1 Hypothetical protein, putative [Bodo saltans]